MIVHGSGTNPSRIVSAPVYRNQNGHVVVIDTASVETIADVAGSYGGLLQGTNGILWYAKNPASSLTIVQRKPDGSTFEQNMPSLNNDGPQDFDFGPDNTLVVVRNDGFRVYRWTLTKNASGFWVLGSSYQLLPSGGTHGKVLPRENGERDYLIECGGTFELYHGDKTLWSGGTESLQSTVVAQGLRVNGFCRDPLTNDIFYTDKSKGLHRLDGVQELMATTPQRWYIRAHLMGLTSLTTVQKNAADYNGDGKVDIADLVKMVLMGK